MYRFLRAESLRRVKLPVAKGEIEFGWKAKETVAVAPTGRSKFYNKQMGGRETGEFTPSSNTQFATVPTEAPDPPGNSE